MSLLAQNFLMVPHLTYIEAKVFIVAFKALHDPALLFF